MTLTKTISTAAGTVFMAGLALGISPMAAQAAPIQPTQQATVAQTATSSSVHAAASARRDLCFTGACGSATVKFLSRSTAYVSMSLKDTACDAKGPTLQMFGLQDHHGSPYTSHGTKHKNTKGCHGGYAPWHGYYGDSDGENLHGLKVRICNGSRCETSTWMNNPYP
ncbi:hypothetical protein [Streptomyces sennicomposti]